MPTLLKKWNETLPDDKMMCPLMGIIINITLNYFKNRMFC